MSRQRLANRRSSINVSLEVDGLKVAATGSSYPNGQLAEIFLSTTRRSSSGAGIMLAELGLVCSLALQHGVPLETIVHALPRDARGNPAGPLGAALALLGGNQK